jgi:hypothetical protein
VNYLYRTAEITLHQCPALRLFSRPGQSYEEFRQACQRAALTRRDEELMKVRGRYDQKIDALEDRREAEAREIGRNEEQLRSREAESRWTTAENFLGLALGRSPRRMFSVSQQKKRLAQKARDEVAESRESVAQLDEKIAALKAEAQQVFQEVVAKWDAAARDIQELRVTPKRADIFVEAFGLGWLPFWQVEVDGQVQEMPAYG